MPRLTVTHGVIVLVLGIGLPARAQVPLPKECTTSREWTLEVIRDKDTGEQVGAKLVGDVEVDCRQQRFSANEIEFNFKTNRMIAQGNVVFATETARIAADRLEFDYQADTGRFHNASGIATLAGPGVDRSKFVGQDPDVYFYGEIIEKIGPRSYRITKGAFTTCVQPTPRWNITSETVTLKLDDYAVLRNAVFRVKGVPFLYLPVFYYPIQEDERATGFLMPQYGSSAVKGHSLRNAFFWAINRSQDATILHDWFSKTGQGFGTDYRYIQAPGSEGSARIYFLREHEVFAPATSSSSSSSAPRLLSPARRSYTIQAAANQNLGHGMRVRGQVDYFSDIAVQQTYFTNIYDASKRQRTIAGNFAGNWGPYTLNATVNRAEIFTGTTTSTLNGPAPKIMFSQAERPIAGLPVYFSVNTDYTRLLRRTISSIEIDQGLTRFDIAPVVRFPFTRLQFLTFNSSLAYRTTRYSERIDLVSKKQIEAPLTRRYIDMQTRIVGPVLQRVFDTPGNPYAERFKHVIEPFVAIQRITPIDVFSQIPQLEADDAIVGNLTRVTYGMTNRMFAKVRGGPTPGNAREMLNLSVSQTYYTDARAALFDRQYGSSFQAAAVTGAQASRLSPVALEFRASPTPEIGANFRAEYDTHFGALRTIGANGTYGFRDIVFTTAGWSQRRFIRGLPGFDDPSRLEHFFNSATNFRFFEGRIGGVYLFNYDFTGNRFLQQRILGYYNAQCCGLVAEFQKIASDRRFNISFSLAGLGTFSNFFGALSGAPR